MYCAAKLSMGDDLFESCIACDVILPAYPKDVSCAVDRWCSTEAGTTERSMDSPRGTSASEFGAVSGCASPGRCDPTGGSVASFSRGASPFDSEEPEDLAWQAPLFEPAAGWAPRACVSQSLPGQHCWAEARAEPQLWTAAASEHVGPVPHGAGQPPQQPAGAALKTKTRAWKGQLHTQSNPGKKTFIHLDPIADGSCVEPAVQRVADVASPAMSLWPVGAARRPRKPILE